VRHDTNPDSSRPDCVEVDAGAPPPSPSLKALLRQLPRHQQILAAVGLVLLLGVLASSGYRYQLTDSAPRGIYRFRPGPIERGRWVILCPPADAARLAVERGYLGSGPCPGGVEPLLKRVAALPGDRVAVARDGLHVNGTRLPASAPLERDLNDLPLPLAPFGEHAVEPGTVWVIGEHPRSFDSRYFGPVDERLVLSVADAVVIWEATP